MRNKVPAGARVVLNSTGQTANDDDQKPGVVNYDVFVDGFEEPLKFTMPRAHITARNGPGPQRFIENRLHEAGHSLVNQVVFPGGYVPTRLSVIEGVAKIANDWVYYAGIASSETGR